MMEFQNLKQKIKKLSQAKVLILKNWPKNTV